MMSSGRLLPSVTVVEAADARQRDERIAGLPDLHCPFRWGNSRFDRLGNAR
jgi:hypothetical protein